MATGFGGATQSSIYRNGASGSRRAAVDGAIGSRSALSNEGAAIA